MTKRARQYLGLLSAVLSYYILHEGAHFLYAVFTQTFRQIRFMGMGIQIDIYADRLTDLQLGIFCVLGSAATFLAAYLLVFLTGRICAVPSKVFKACMYYVTIAMLLLDPLYLSLLCGFFGGGDMNGISLLLPETAARLLYGFLLILNGIVFVRLVLPKYRHAFAEPQE